MSELAQAIEEMRNMRESYDQLSEAAVAYNEGKPALAEAITAKGVEAASTDSLATMAEKVMTISQDTYEIDGGEMYAKQLFGVANNDIVPGYWNLYDVLAQLLSDGRLVNYGGILLAEYYKGYTSLQLSGAGAGGAYVVSDKDENGQFKMYTEDTTHTWATEFDGKGNRWVAYCFADEYHNFEITNTDTSPRSIFIGRKVGTISSLVNGRCAVLVISDGNKLEDFIGDHTQQWNKRCVLRNIQHHTSGGLIYNNTVSESVCVEVGELSADACILRFNAYNSSYPISSLVVKGNTLSGNIIKADSTTKLPNLATVIIDSDILGGYLLNGTSGISEWYPNVSIIAETVSNFNFNTWSGSVKSIYFGYRTNDKSQSVSITCYSTFLARCPDVVIQDGWCKNLNISKCSGIAEDGTTNNITEHILKRLKQDEPDCGDGVTITLGATNLAKLTSEESVQLLDNLTNIYGYTFA